MSIAEAERFANDLSINQALLAEVTSRSDGLAPIVEVANAHGYEVTLEEARQYMESQSPQELTDEQLDAVAGGTNKQWWAQTPPNPSPFPP